MKEKVYALIISYVDEDSVSYENHSTIWVEEVGSREKVDRAIREYLERQYNDLPLIEFIDKDVIKVYFSGKQNHNYNLLKVQNITQYLD